MGRLTTYRNCPACGAGAGIVRLWFLAWIGAKWDCPACGARLGINVGRRIVVALVAAPFTAIALFFAFDKDWLWSLLMLAISFMLWRFDSLRLAQGAART